MHNNSHQGLLAGREPGVVMEEAKRLLPWMRELRRAIHRHPEPGFREFKTASLLSARLDEAGIPHTRGIAGTGIVADISRGSSSAAPSGLQGGTQPCVALRADMDALPLLEETGLPFSSTIPGMMHACGHDGHCAMLAGAALILNNTAFDGKVRLIFQPAEEGTGGACRMIEHGVLDGVDLIFGGHIDRHFQTGAISVQEGLICAYTDTFRIDIWGKGGHAARPHEAVDSVVAASHLVISLQSLVSRELNPSYPSVITVGSISGGSAPNIIAEKARLRGTIRTTHPDIRDKVLEGIKRMVRANGELFGASSSIVFEDVYPPVINHPDATAIAREAAVLAAGEHNVVSQAHPSLGGEDFSFYLEKIPGCFVRFGACKPGHEYIPAHSSRFDFDEQAMVTGAGFLALVAMKALERLAARQAAGKAQNHA